ncbi:hypothetical protein [Halomonas litopenaei]|uniref:hypothetical protein n=1 Tax=Halomonas litopenaei TaxID=2109328 RepID=UPI003F9F7BAE
MARLTKALVAAPGRVAAMAGVALGYALLFLWLSGDIDGGGSGWQLAFPAWERALETRGAWRFEPVGLIELGPWVWTFSPINTLIALALGLLLGANLVGLWLRRRVGTLCPIRRPGGGGLAALPALPALLAGGACCAPLLAIWIGLPIAGGLAVLSPWLVPLSFAGLALALWRLAVAFPG